MMFKRTQKAENGVDIQFSAFLHIRKMVIFILGFSGNNQYFSHESFFYKVFHYSAIPQIVVDKSLNVLEVNNALLMHFQLNPDKAGMKSFGEIVDCQKNTAIMKDCSKCKVKNCPIQKIVCESLNSSAPPVCSTTSFSSEKEKNYKTRWVQISGVKVECCDSNYVVLTFIDITKQKHKETLYKKRLELDPLTGLMNKQGLMNSIKRLANKKLPISYSLCMIDLDDFKNINDQCGHLTGDKVLKIFAKIIRKNIDDNDLAGRFGGEEFIIIFLHDNSQKVLHTLQGIHGQLNQSFKHDIPFPVSFSAGIIFINDNESAKVLTDLLLMVDRYLYDAKSRGKGRAVSPLGEFIFNIEH